MMDDKENLYKKLFEHFIGSAEEDPMAEMIAEIKMTILLEQFEAFREFMRNNPGLF